MSSIKEYLFEKLEELAYKYDFTYEEVLDYYDAMGGLDIKIDPIEFLDGFLKWKKRKERVMSKIIHNKIMCRHCKDIIESEFLHHFVMCSCGRCAVDGGKTYLRRMGVIDVDWIDMSEIEEVNQNE